MPTITEPAQTRPLTKREIEVLGYVAQGLGDKQIGAKLFVSPRTVNFHLVNAFDKLGVRNRVQAINAARKNGILQ